MSWKSNLGHLHCKQARYPLRHSLNQIQFLMSRIYLLVNSTNLEFGKMVSQVFFHVFDELFLRMQPTGQLASFHPKTIEWMNFRPEKKIRQIFKKRKFFSKKFFCSGSAAMRWEFWNLARKWKINFESFSVESWTHGSKGTLNCVTTFIVVIQVRSIGLWD